MTTTIDSWREGVDLAMPELLAQRGAKRIKRRQSQRVRTRSGVSNKARPLGRGLDFSELRPYQAGDELRFIDWKTTARRGQVHSKLFQEERERPVLLLVDQRVALRYGTRVCFKSVQCARFAAAVAWRAAGQGDKVGALVFNDHRHSEVPPAAGDRGVARVCQTLVRSHAETAQSTLPMDQMLKELARVTHAGGEAWVISDFHDWNQEAQLTLGGVCRRAAVQMVHVVDPLEWQLPAGRGCMVSDGQQWRLLPSSNSSDAA
ncbi:MAG: DUF58 domain-containing protein, partial [Granulosicoccaceae bacterium]